MTEETPKYLRKTLNRFKYPQLLIFYEKHANRYILVNSEKELFTACYRILKERKKDGYWYDDDQRLKEATKAGPLSYEAYLFLRDHSDGEYDRMEVVEPEKAND